MFRHITKAGQYFQDAMYIYMADFMDNELVPDTYDYTKLFGLWIGKGSKYRKIRTKQLDFPGRYCENESHDGGCKKGCNRCQATIRVKTTSRQYQQVTVFGH